MGNSLHETIKFYNWLTGVYSDYGQATYFHFSIGFLSHKTREELYQSDPFKK